tara:strand:- start:5239 stop:5904 length:666 start_codon:yes stop_codon:yes gene_type:complete
MNAREIAILAICALLKRVRFQIAKNLIWGGQGEDMKNKALKLVSALAISAASSWAQAVPIVFTDVVAPVNVPIIAVNSFFPSFYYTHSILDDGYNPATDTLVSAEIIFKVRDDIRNEEPFPYDPSADPMVAVLDDAAHIYSYEVNFSDIVQNVDLAIITDGVLIVNLRIPQPRLPEWSWDFYQSTLNVVADRNADVPLPGTVLLIGAGLASLGIARRRRRS